MTEFNEKNYFSAAETERSISVARPPIIEELFTNPPAEFAGQIAERAACLPAIREVSETLMKSGRPLPDAIWNEEISKTTARELYTGLAYLLEDPDSQRIALYLPFDFLQKPPDSDETDSAYELLVQNYRSAWWELLRYRDKRADFTDGNLPDDRDVPIEMVVKAAHLIPELLELDIITNDEVDMLLAQSSGDQILQQSIHDALNIQTNDQWSYVRADMLEIPADTGDAYRQYEQEVQNVLEHEGEILPSRANWLRTVIREQLVDSLARKIADSNDAYNIAVRLNGRDAMDTQISLAVVERLLHQQLAPGSALEFFEFAMHSKDAPVREQAVLSLQRLCRSIDIPDKLLETKTIPLPRLAGNLSENIRTETTDRLNQQTVEMENNSLLNKHVYPVLLVGGSSLKGYAAPNSDVDVSVFVRPETPRELQPELRAELSKILDTDAIEFWLDNDGENMKIHDFEEFDFHEADSEWTHLLMQSLWIGNGQAVSELRQRILPGYYAEDGFDRYKYLLRIEQDILQYRLLQKGYARAYAPDFENHDNMPDGHSMFWDRGFRLLATRLFAEKVFLPNRQFLNL